MRAVIFDFDGTIADSLVAVIKVCERVRGGTPLTPEQRKNLQNKSMLQIAIEMHVPKWKILYLFAWGRQIFRHHMRSIQVHPGMAELIKELHDQEVALYVLSVNRTANVRQYLNWHNLDGYFRGIYGGASFFSKARAMTRLVRRETLDTNQTWCIGDERVDVRSAHSAGLKVIAVSWGYSSYEQLESMDPEYVVKTTESLREVLSECLRR